MKLKNKIKKHPYKDTDGKTYIQFEDIPILNIHIFFTNI